MTKPLPNSLKHIKFKTTLNIRWADFMLVYLWNMIVFNIFLYKKGKRVNSRHFAAVHELCMKFYANQRGNYADLSTVSTDSSSLRFGLLVTLPLCKCFFSLLFQLTLLFVCFKCDIIFLFDQLCPFHWSNYFLSEGSLLK